MNKSLCIFGVEVREELPVPLQVLVAVAVVDRLFKESFARAT